MVPSYTYSYDGMGRLTEVKDPLGYSTDVTYDVNNNIVKAVLNQYDSFGNIRKTEYTAQNNDKETYTFSYDALNRITSEEKKVTKADITPAADVVRYTYDSLGNGFFERIGYCE